MSLPETTALVLDTMSTDLRHCLNVKDSASLLDGTETSLID